MTSTTLLAANDIAADRAAAGPGTDAATTAATTAERQLRAVLALNAATSAAAGLVALVAGGWVADLLDVSTVGIVRLVGAALVVFALDVALVARATPARLRRGAALVSAADAAWVVATVVLVAAGAFGGAGVAVAAVMGVGVADFGALQLWFRHRMPRS
jgi:hypothetical protein